MIEIGEYARNESGIYKIIGKYERRYSYDLCVQLGIFIQESLKESSTKAD